MTFNTIPTSLLLLLLIQAVWIFAFFGIIQHILLKAIRNERWYDFVAFYNPLLRNTVWILFAIKAVYHLANVNAVVSLAAVGVILALAWQSVRDFVQGTIFRFQKGDITGQFINVRSFSGVVHKMQNTKIDLLTNEEEIIQIPYGHIISTITTKPTAAKYLKTGTVLVNVEQNADIESQKRNIKTQLLILPWIVSSKGIKMEYLRDQQQIKASFATLNDEFIERVRVALGA